jgi:integrase
LRHQTAEHQFTSMVKRAVESGGVMEWPYHHSYPTPHNLRHSYITWALSEGRISPVEIARRSGHSLGEMWKTYAASLTGDKSKMDAWQEARSPRRSASETDASESGVSQLPVGDASPGSRPTSAA